MKKVNIALFMTFAIAGNVMAADAGSAIVNAEQVPNTAAGCSLLSEPVTLNISNGVVGAYACNTEDNIIGVATCHANGRKSVTFDCNPSLEDDDAGYVEGCEAVDGSTTVGTATADNGVAYVASTRGGRVAGVPAANCSGTGATTVAEAQDAALL